MGAMILFVEDNEDLRDNATLVLELEGYQVRAAEDGVAALELLKDGFVPDLIVSDIMMPRMDGYEFFQTVRQYQHLRGVPFIFLTARSSRQDITTGRVLGADDYLVKPFDPQEFLIAIENKLKRTAEMRAQVNESLNGARRALVQLLSHELRTPLTYVTGGFALLAEELQAQPSLTAEDIHVSLDLIQSGTQRLNRLAEQMVLYSEIATGHVASQVVHISDCIELEFLVNDALVSLTALTNERETTFVRVMPEEDVIVCGVKDLLLIAVVEVIRNAIQYSPPGEPIELVMKNEDDYGVLQVIDAGEGIAEEDQPKIWDLLVQIGRDRHEQQGVGMGLPIVKGIVTAHHGDVELQSTPGQGTVVTLRLPRQTPGELGSASR